METKKVLIAGGSGFIGKKLGFALFQSGFKVIILSRQKNLKEQLPFPFELKHWDGQQIPSALDTESINTVINLCGSNVAETRWNKAGKIKLAQSRITSSKVLSKFANDIKAKTYIQASAIGIYGHSPYRVSHEDTLGDNAFLSRLGRQWEQSKEAPEGETRHVILRIGVVLGATGGFLEKMYPLYGSHLGILPGSGKQFISWIHIDDLCEMFLFLMKSPKLMGVFNATAPNPVPYKQLHDALSSRLGVSNPIVVPRFFIKAALQEKSHIILDSVNSPPTRILQSNFEFKHKEIETCLEDIFPEKAKYTFLFEQQQWLPSAKKETWKFFSSAKNLERITPPWLKFSIRELPINIEQDSKIKYSISFKGVPMSWLTRISEWKPQESFTDVQEKGPYQLWKHQHKFFDLNQGTLMTDKVVYRLPFGPLGAIVHALFVRNQIKEIFEYRLKKMNTMSKNSNYTSAIDTKKTLVG